MGDHGPLGSIVTAAYFAAAMIALAAGKPRAFTFPSAAALAALGANKQLDLQTHLFAFGRREAFALGVYEHRDLLHVVFPIVVGLALLAALAIVLRASWPHRRKLLPVMLGFALLAAFIVLRVARFSHLQRVLGWTWLGGGVAHVLELVAIVLIAGGFIYVRSQNVSATPGSRPDRS